MDKFGIVFSSRTKSMLLWILGIWVCFSLGSSTLQVFQAYRAGEGFDANVSQMVWGTVLLFAPYYFVTGFMLRSLTTRLSLMREIKKQIVISEYTPPQVLSAAEAGLLIDDNFDINEIAAVLKSLELRGCLKITTGGTIPTLELLHSNNITKYESKFIEVLFADSDIFHLSADTRPILLKAGEVLAAQVRQQMISEGLLKDIQSFKIYRLAFGIFLRIAAFVQILWTGTLIYNPSLILQIGYPRYPMSIIEPILMSVLVVSFVAVVLSGFWNKRLSDSNGLKNWRYVAGLKSYIATVYKGKFYNGNNLTVTKSELYNFYPYAIAFGIEKTFTHQLESAMLRPF